MGPSNLNSLHLFASILTELYESGRMLVQRTPPPPARDRDALIVRPSAGKKSRLLSLDAFRGFTMVGLILVDNQGTSDCAQLNSRSELMSTVTSVNETAS